MKLSGDDVVRSFKGLAIAAARANDMAKEHGKEKLLANLPRRQQDTVRQLLFEIEADFNSLMQIMAGKRDT